MSFDKVSIMKKLTLILLAGLILQACENAPVRREEMISEHPEWDKEMVEVIKAGYLVKGMDQDQVKAAWGRPCWSCTGTTSGDWGEAWEYSTQVVFFDKNGKVTRWEQK
jgi:hypothetical protein